MSSPAVLLKYSAVVLMTLTGVLGGVLAARSASSDVETTQAVGSTAPWLVLAIALSAFAFWSRRIAPWAFVALTAFTVVRGSVESAQGLTDRDDPFAAIWVLVLGVALGYLALHHTRLAGGLLVALGVDAFAAVATGHRTEACASALTRASETRGRKGRGPGDRSPVAQ